MRPKTLTRMFRLVHANDSVSRLQSAAQALASYGLMKSEAYRAILAETQRIKDLLESGDEESWNENS